MRRGNSPATGPFGAPERLRYVAGTGSRPTLMDFRILGPLEALDEGQPVALGGSKQRALLALLLHANETLSTIG